jgi:L-rhamnose mutarotase
MKIELSKEEYRSLLDLLYLGEWLLDAHDEVKDSEKQRYEDVIQKVYSYAKEADCENLIEYAEDMKQYFPTREYEDTSMCHQYIDEYDDESFWYELMSRLIERDIQQMIREGVIIAPMTGEERLRIGYPIETKYQDEFEENGLDNVVIRKNYEQNSIN